MSIIEELLDILPSCIIANQFNEFATGLSRRCTSISKSSVRLLGVGEQGIQGLKRVRKEFKRQYGIGYLIRHPDAWINDAIQDHMTSALGGG